MVRLETLDVSIISFIILSIVLIHSYNRLDRIFIQYRLFLTLVIMNIFLIVLDLASWFFNGQPGAIGYFGNIICNFIQFATVPLLPGVWIIYIYYMVYQDARYIGKIKWFLTVAFLIHFLIVVASLYTGWFFYVDSANIYHRGPLFLLHFVYNYLIMGYALFFLLSKRKYFPKRQFYSMLGFFIAPVAGTLIQAFVYGVSYNWAGMALALLVVYMNLQSRSLNTDHLTGINNRLHLQVFLKMKIRNTSEKNTFGAIMVDIDRFKEINDKFGHGVGDEALKDAAGILRDTLRRDDFIARFGGDEFIVIIDVDNFKMLEDAVNRIKESVRRFNQVKDKPYDISFSMGYDIYKPFERLNYEEYLAHVDKLMYENKRVNKITRD